MNGGLRFEWDAHNITHLASHNVRSDEAEQAPAGELMDLDHSVTPDGEERWTAAGQTAAGRILVHRLDGARKRILPDYYCVPGNQRTRSSLLSAHERRINNMDQPQPIPRFSNETEEADWWYQQRDRLTAHAETALSRGELKLRRLDQLPAQATTPARNITIRVAEQDLARARDLAARRGLRYQTYLKMLLHEALDNEERRQTQRP